MTPDRARAVETEMLVQASDKAVQAGTRYRRALLVFFVFCGTTLIAVLGVAVWLLLKLNGLAVSNHQLNTQRTDDTAAIVSYLAENQAQQSKSDAQTRAELLALYVALTTHTPLQLPPALAPPIPIPPQSRPKPKATATVHPAPATPTPAPSATVHSVSQSTESPKPRPQPTPTQPPTPKPTTTKQPPIACITIALLPFACV